MPLPNCQDCAIGIHVGTKNPNKCENQILVAVWHVLSGYRCCNCQSAYKGWSEQRGCLQCRYFKKV